MIPYDLAPTIYFIAAFCVVMLISFVYLGNVVFDIRVPSVAWIFIGLMTVVTALTIVSITFSSPYTETITVCSHNSGKLLGTNGIVYGGINTNNELLVIDGNTITITEINGIGGAADPNWIYKIERTSPIACGVNLENIVSGCK